MCPGLKQNTFTALARRTNQKSYLIRNTCDCLNNITVDAASLPPGMRTPPCTHTHGISNRISSPLSLSLPRFHNLSLSNLPTLLYFPVQYSPSNTFPSSPAPSLAPSISPPLLLQAPLSATLAPAPSFGGHSEPLEGWVEKKKLGKSNFSLYYQQLNNAVTN